MRACACEQEKICRRRFLDLYGFFLSLKKTQTWCRRCGKDIAADSISVDLPGWTRSRWERRFFWELWITPAPWRAHSISIFISFQSLSRRCSLLNQQLSNAIQEMDLWMLRILRHLKMFSLLARPTRWSSFPPQSQAHPQRVVGLWLLWMHVMFSVSNTLHDEVILWEFTTKRQTRRYSDLRLCTSLLGRLRHSKT